MDLAKAGPGNSLEHSVQVGRLYDEDAKQVLLEWVTVLGTTYGLTSQEAEEFVELYGKLIEVEKRRVEKEAIMNTYMSLGDPES